MIIRGVNPNPLPNPDPNPSQARDFEPEDELIFQRDLALLQVRHGVRVRVGA